MFSESQTANVADTNNTSDLATFCELMIMKKLKIKIRSAFLHSANMWPPVSNRILKIAITICSDRLFLHTSMFSFVINMLS